MSTTDTATLYACPAEGCLIFPYDRQDDLDGHIASGDHVYAGSWKFSNAELEAARPERGDGEGEGSGRGSAADPSVVSWSKFEGVWVLKGVGLTEGAEVTVTKKDGTTQQATVGKLVQLSVKDGFDLAHPAAKTADEAIRWAKSDGGWALRIPTGVAEVGATVTVSKRDGTTTEAIVGVQVGSGDGYTLHEASKVEEATTAVSADSVALVAGKVYMTTEGDVVRVQESKAGRLYGKVWNAQTEEFEYCTGCLKEVDHELSADEAAAFGHSTSICVFCSRALEDKRSTAMGYGPTCAAKHGLPWGE